MAVQQRAGSVRYATILDTVKQNKALVSGTLMLLGIAVGALVKPELFYDRFIWQYFWGPIVADAGSGTAVHNGVVAHKGYTLVNEIGYGLLLGYVFLLLTTGLRRFSIGTEPGFVLAFVPFAIGGGLLRVVEDVAAQQSGLLTGPLQYVLITPVIHMVLFAAGLLMLLAGAYLQRFDVVDDYRVVVAGLGTVFALGLATVLVSVADVVRLWMLPASVGIAGGVLALTYIAGTTVLPAVKTVLTAEGAAVLFSHLLDASSTALSIEALGYGEKHPIVEYFILQTGNAYWFILLKLAVIGGILYYMQDEAFRNDDPLFYNFILLGILIVGLGPGVRNMTRAILGV